MQSRCRKLVRDCSISVASLAVSISLVGAITILTSQSAFADSKADTVLLAQAPQSDEAAGDEKTGTTSGGTGSRSSSSERIRKYLGDEGPPGGGGRPPGGPGPGQGPGPDDMGNKRERMRQMLQQMPPEKRDQIMQEMRERRMQKRGLSDGANSGGMDNRFVGPPDGGPDGGPGLGGRPGGRGVSEYGFKRNGGRRNFGGPGDKGMKGGKLFGREPLDLTVLNLTADQKTKIQSMRTVDGQKSRQIQSELRQRRDKFKEMLFDPAATSDQIISTHKEINKLQSQTQDIMLNDFLGIRKLLTKEQLDLLPQVRPDEPRRPSPRLSTKAPPDGPPPDSE